MWTVKFHDRNIYEPKFDHAKPFKAVCKKYTQTEKTEPYLYEKVYLNF